MVLGKKKFWDQKYSKNPTKFQKSQETKVQKLLSFE
jgi:hypothetical protein